MLELNRGERRALWLATVIVLVGAAARLGLAPGERAFSWTDPPVVAAEGAADAPPGAPGGRDAARPTSGAPGDAEGPLDEARRAVRDGVARAARASMPLEPGERLDPNVAAAEELDRLPGVGPATARAILEERGSGGPFRSLEDMLRVSGIGPARLARMADHLALPAEARTDRGDGRGPGPGALDLNRADRAALERLPGIGPALAGRILDLRGREGPFRSPEDLLAVPGIGPVTLRKLEGLVVVR